MNEQIIEMIEKEIINTLSEMKVMEPGSKEREDAMKYVSDLYDTLNSERKCLIDSRKMDNEEDKSKFDKILSIGKLGIDLFGAVGPLLLYNSWLHILILIRHIRHNLLCYYFLKNFIIHHIFCSSLI